MSCVGCNDGCFDESVQLAQGPAGADGQDGQDGAQGPAGADGNDGFSVLDYRVADGGVFFGGAAYFPGYHPAGYAAGSLVNDGQGNNLETTIPANTLLNEGDFLRIRVEGGVTSPTQLLESTGAAIVEVHFDGEIVAQVEVGQWSNVVGSQGFYLEVDIAYIDNPLSTPTTMQTSQRVKHYQTNLVAFGTVQTGLMQDANAKTVTRATDFTIQHEVQIRVRMDQFTVVNPGGTIGVGGTTKSSDPEYDNLYITHYEVLKFKK